MLNRILLSWSFYMKFIKLAEGEMTNQSIIRFLTLLRPKALEAAPWNDHLCEMLYIFWPQRKETYFRISDVRQTKVQIILRVRTVWSISFLRL